MSYYRIQPAGCNDVVAGAIASGPDDNIWLSLSGVTGSGPYCSLIAKFSLTGHTFTFYDAGNSDGLVTAITAGPDGNVWFTDTKGYVGRMTTGGTLTKFAFAGYGAGSVPSGLVAGQDHALWFTYGPYTDTAPSGIARITTAGSITEYPHTIGNCEGPSETDPIVSAPDGYLWFGCYDRLAKSTTAGTITDYPASLLDYTGASVRSLAWGADNDLWIGGGTGTIGKFKP
jgi:virginiamycin B lyase